MAPAGTFLGSSTAKPGETVTLWRTGFGPVSPSMASGRRLSAANGGAVAYASNPPSLTIGGVTAQVVAAGLNSDALDLYQIAIKIVAGLVGVPHGAVGGALGGGGIAAAARFARGAADALSRARSRTG